MIVFLGWNVDIDLPDFEGTTDNSELTTITTACLPTSVTSATTCTVTVMPSRTTTTTTAGQPTVSLINRVSVGTAKATPTTRDRGTGDWNQRNYDRFTLSKTQIS